MLQNRSFVKKTRGGRVLKVVREHYLRDDIWCGVAACRRCSHGPEEAALCESSKRILVVDTNIVLHQLDVLDHECVTDIVIPSTVIEEVKKRNQAAYSRLRALCANPRKHFYVFANEHHRATYVEQQDKESPNDRNDRAIRQVASWYQDHVRDFDIEVVLLSDDKDNRAKAAESSLRSLSAREYADFRASDAPELLDRVAPGGAECADDDESHGSARKRQRKCLYDDHMADAAIAAGLRSGKYHQGTVRVSPYNLDEAYVRCERIGDVLVKGKPNLNRATNGDIVAIEVLEESKWEGEDCRLRRADADGADTDGASLAASIMDTTPQDGPQCGDANGARRTNAKVVGIIRRSWRSRGYAGHLCVASDSVHGAGPKSLLFQPVDRRLPRVRISTRQAATLADKRIVVVIDSWAADSPFPNGHYVRTLGKLGDREAETEAVLLEHDINTAPFTRAVHACVPALPWAVDPGVDLAPGPMFTRQDLRDLDVCSVDPPGCKDIDDALHVRRLPSDADHPHERIEVGVHIADVTHFVREGTPIDEEAAARSTTTYLVERRIDMLPKALTEEICSLKPNVDRLAFSVLWEMTPEGEPLRQPRFCKSVIRSRAALTYVEAQMRIDGTDKAGDDAITDSLRLMNQVAKSLRRKRFAAGALELASPEVKFEIDTETHNPTDVGVYHLHDTNRMVEEMMLLANIAVANRILKGFPGSAVLRRHPHPTASLFAPLVAATAAAGFDIDVKTSKSVAKSLDQCVRSDDPYFNRLVRIMATRCMTQAVYCSSAEVASQDLHHYGLATPLYTHFTSPIRRYADCLVHRLLAACEGLGPAPARLGDRGWMRGVVNNMNERHRNAQLAGRASVELYTLMFFHGRPTKEIGRVVRVRANGLIVLVPKYGIEGPVYFYRKGEEASPWKLDEGGQRATDPTGVRSYQVFDQVPVTISVREDARGLRELMLALRDEA